ncbi:MAG: hypothetical protein RMJ38_06435, partial [candidate division WOR-3 bacterium]|nr:hypothetical protein [candidate division WOR-3 bacterium]MDW8151059.1 hypothetical protein [candidate division WOR-3 bacterium]
MMIYLINSIYGGFGGFSVGISFVDNKQLSNYLSDRGYPELKSVDLSSCGFGYGIFRNFVIGGLGFGGFSNSDNKSNKYARYGLSGGAFSLGYVIYSSGKLLVYPLFNIGGYSYNLKLYEKSNGSLDDVITNP